MKKIYWAIPVTFLLVLIMAMPAAAVDFKVGSVDLNVGGSARLDAGWMYDDKGDVPDGETGYQSKMFVTIPSDTNIYIKAVKSNLLAYAELGISDPHLNDYLANAYVNPSITTKDNGAVRIRYAYAQYSFNSSNALLVGQTDCMFSQMTPKQYLYDDNLMQGFGVVMNDRYPQVRYIFTRDNILAQVAIQQPVVSDPTDFRDLTDSYEANDVIPAVVGSMTYKVNDNLSLIPNLYFQYYQFKADDPTKIVTKDIDVTTFGLCLNAESKISMLDLTAGIWWGVNLGIFGNDKRFNLSSTSPIFGAPIGNNYASEVEDSTGIKNIQSYGGWIQAAVNAGPGLFRAGLGGQRAQTGINSHGYTENIYTWAIFANYTYELVKNFSIAPEIIFMDNGYDVDRTNLGNTSMAGVHFQYDF